MDTSITERGPIVGRMKETEYDQERTRLRGLYGDSRKEAGARFEQALATLFYVSGWTQEELAKKEGKSRVWVQQRLQFGRFLNFVTTVTNLENAPLGLTEGRFRSFWEQTDSSETNGRIRYQAVLRLMQEDALAPRSRHRGPTLAKAVRDQFADGKWRALETIAELVSVDGQTGAPADEVQETLRNMVKGDTKFVTCEKKPVKNTHHYRLFPQERQVSTVELTEKLAEPLARLKEQGKANMATMSPPTVAYWTATIQTLLNEWSGRPKKTKSLK
jgi:transcriptional regulator with XRE-family HTH domain